MAVSLRDRLRALVGAAAKANEAANTRGQGALRKMDHAQRDRRSAPLGRRANQLSGCEVRRGKPEFPRLNEALLGKPYRYAYCMGLSPRAAFVESATCLYKHDLEGHTRQVHDFGPDSVPGEFVFVPKAGASGEDEGWLMGYVLDANTQTTDLVILDAARFQDAPQARITIPHRVPPGFHGNWFPEGQLLPQNARKSTHAQDSPIALAKLWNALEFLSVARRNSLGFVRFGNCAGVRHCRLRVRTAKQGTWSTEYAGRHDRDVADVTSYARSGAGSQLKLLHTAILRARSPSTPARHEPRRCTALIAISSRLNAGVRRFLFSVIRTSETLSRR